MERVTVPFSLERYGEGFRSQVTTRGVVRLDAAALVIEFRETTTSYVTLSEESGAVHEIRVPLADLESVEAVGGLWSPRLRIRTRTLTALNAVPGAKGNECELRIRRRDRTGARELAVATSLALSSRELRRLEEGDL